MRNRLSRFSAITDPEWAESERGSQANVLLNMLVATALLTLFAGPTSIRLIVGGVPREALVFRPATVASDTPVIFCFHGHGGSALQASRSFDIQDAWPKAICVYPQGLPTKSPYIDPAGKFNGWDVVPSKVNKDVLFFDSLYEAVFKQVGGDPRRVYAMGHSNGGYFMYTLWEMRPQKIAAFGSFEAAKGRCDLTVPRPLFVSIGSEDKIVPPLLQRRSLRAVMVLDGSSSDGASFGSCGTYYPGTQPVALWAYPGGHAFPKDSVPSLVDFLQRFAL